MDNTQNVISFCTGYGGLELGIRRAGVDVRTIVNVEIEAFAQGNLVAKIEEGRMDDAASWTDLKTFPASIFRGKIHGITGGYPCQPFSSAGKRKGEEDPRHLWPYIRKHIRAIGPSWVFAENVQGHATMGLWRVLSDLEEEGYETTWGIFSAEEVGAPHQRKRVFILGRLSDSDFEGLEGSVFGGIAEEETEKPVTRCGKEGDKLSDSASFGFGGTLPIEDREGEGRNDACGEGATEGMGATELGDPASERPCGGSENCEGEQSEVLGERLESDELAHPASREPRQSQARNGGQDIGGGSEDTQWPSRPGEEQYEWEEPRVVADSKHSKRRADKGLPARDERREGSPGDDERCIQGDITEIIGELGGTVDGPRSGVDPIANRVDRLRLLGNGVVPQTAELAWRTLWKQLNDKYDD